MYYIAAGMMLVCAIIVLKVLPDIQTNFKGKYSDLMKSLVALVKEFPQLRIYSIRAALNFGSLLAMWSCLAFKMAQAPFFATSDVIGLLGLCGVAGALTASFLLVGCTPRIEVAAPKEPITINMNVKIEHEIIIKADKDVEELLETRSDLF